MRAGRTSECEHDSLADKLAAVLERAGGAMRIESLKRLTGGAAHETWAFDAVDGGGGRHALVLRRALSDGLCTNTIGAEFALLERLHRRGLPVARPWLCGVDASELGAPYMVTARAGARDLRKQLAHAQGTADRAALARDVVRLQVTLHAVEDEALPANDPLARWATFIEGTHQPWPMLAIAIDWLRDRPLASSATTLVHGDFKANNLVFGDTGAMTVIDWELAHRGDPLEDVAWTLQWTTADDIVDGLLPRASYLDAYADLSGRPIDTDRLHYWEVFAQVKLAAMFLAGAAPRAQGRGVRPSYVQLYRALPVLEKRLARLLRGAGGTADVP